MTGNKRWPELSCAWGSARVSATIGLVTIGVASIVDGALRQGLTLAGDMDAHLYLLFAVPSAVGAFYGLVGIAFNALFWPHQQMLAPWKGGQLG